MNVLTRAIAGACLVLALLALLPAKAGADVRPRLVVLDEGQGALAERIRAELSTMGFDALVVTPPPGESPPTTLEQLARSHDASAVVRMVPADGGARAILYDRTTGKTLSRDIQGGPRGDALIALRAVELLRASLLELGLPDAPRGEVAVSPALLKAAQVPAPVALEPPAPVRPLVAVELGFGGLGSRGALPPEVALAITASALAGPALRVGILALVPLSSMSHQAAEGSSETKTTVVGAELRRQTLGSGWHSSLGAGAALSVLVTRGRGVGPLYRDSSATRFAGGPYLRGAASYGLTRTFSLRIDAAIGAQLAPFALSYAGRQVATWGQPWLAGWLAAEVVVP